MSLVMLGAAKKGDKGRPDGDFYETPPVAVGALLKNETFRPFIWEPACGNGAISKILKKEGMTVASSDLCDHGYGFRHDFLQGGWDGFAAVCDIITNPPFSLADEFLTQALSYTVSGQVSKVAFLLRLNFLEGQKRAKIFKEFPPSRVLVFSKRLPMMHRPNYTGKKSTSTVAYAWFIFEKPFGKCEIKWI